MRIYVAGPMSNLPGHNLPAFAAAAVELDALGYDAVNPGRHGADDTFTWQDYMRRDLIDLIGCDAVALLPGWENSRGAQLEAYVARQLAMPVEPLEARLAQAEVAS